MPSNMDIEDAATLLANFHFHFLDSGGLFMTGMNIGYNADFDFYRNIMTEIVSSVISGRVAKGNPKILLAYINDTTVNAVASRYQDHHYIGINSGVVYLLERLFNSMLSNPEILINIGNIDIETKGLPVNIEEYTDVQNFIDAQTLVNYDIPKDAERLTTAKLLTALALGFLACHETTHIINGHIDYLNANFNIATIQESRFTESQRADFLLSQTLEFDADAIGICDLINFVLHANAFSNKLPEIFVDIVKNRQKLIGLTMFATYTVFRLFGDDSFEDESSIAQDYPTFDFRRRLSGKTVLQLIQYKRQKGRFDKDTEEELGKSVIDYLLQAELAFLFLENKVHSEDRSFLEKKLTAEHLLTNESHAKHIEILTSNWDKLKKSLEKYSYAGLF